MEKKFEKITMFSGHTWEVVSMFERHIADCHAEIDRLKAELIAIRAQVPTAEREWIRRETHERFPVAGSYFYICRETGIKGSTEKSLKDFPTHGYDYTLIFTEKDCPVPPKPDQELEIKVGKYRWPDGDIASVWAIDKTGVCAYQSGLGVNNLRLVEKGELRRLFESHHVTFIGEGDNQ